MIKGSSKQIQWTAFVTVLKAAEGGPGLSCALSILRRAGVRAKSSPSCYVGHTTLLVEKGSITKARKALRPLGLRP